MSRSKRNDNTIRDMLILSVLLVFGIFAYYANIDYREHREINNVITEEGFKDMDNKLDIAIELASMNLFQLEQLKVDLNISKRK